MTKIKSLSLFTKHPLKMCLIYFPLYNIFYKIICDLCNLKKKVKSALKIYPFFIILIKS